MNKVDFINKQTRASVADKRQDDATKSLLVKVTPWLAGAGIAAGHILTSSNCTIPQQGKCSTCGSCVVALGSLVAWALAKKNNSDDFYMG